MSTIRGRARAAVARRASSRHSGPQTPGFRCRFADTGSHACAAGAHTRASTKAGVAPLLMSDALANLGTRGVVRPSSRRGDRRRVLLRHELGCASGADGGSPKALAARLICAGEQAHRADAFVAERAPSRLAAWLPEWTRTIRAPVLLPGGAGARARRSRAPVLPCSRAPVPGGCPK
jgi:hypothetical protein